VTQTDASYTLSLPLVLTALTWLQPR